MTVQDRLFISTASLKNNRDLPAVLSTYFDLGFRKIEISALHHYQALDDLAETIERFQKKGVIFIYHNYFPRPEEDIVLNVMSQDKKTRKQSLDLIAQAIELARRTDVDLYCFHPGYLGDPTVLTNGMFDFSGKKPWDKREGVKRFCQDFMSFYKDLEIDGKPQRVYVGIENLFPPSAGDNFSTFCSYSDMAEMFSCSEIADSNLGILIDLGHLAIAANILKFDREEYLQNVIRDFGDRIYEVHLSENDQREDLHERITEQSWQLNALGKFKDTGRRLNGAKTRFCIESRGLTPEEIKTSYHIVKRQLESCLI